MRSITRRLFVAGLSAGIALAAGSAMAQDTVVMRIAHNMPETHSYAQWLGKFREVVEEKLPGRFDIRVFPAAQLGTETEYLESMQLGTLDGAIMGRHGQIDARLDVLNLPMIFDGDAHVDAVLHSDSEVRGQLEDILYEKGFKVLAWGELGFRHITTNGKEVRTADDLKGIDIRVPNVQPWLTAFRAWGANPTPLPFEEVYSALQQGVMSAQENPPENIYTSKFYEVQKTMSLTEHANIPSEFMLSRAFWEKLPEDAQAVMLEAAQEGSKIQVAAARQANADLVAKLEELGLTIVRDVDKESFRAGAEESYSASEATIGRELIDAVLSTK
ncbi:TRAP transporter substrate-binding protein [Mesorhizobium xinjiangense]|uniref:TRAP transporter substrate-binding protein n=1 Tax=Mesorhizobium xinjiangense TaxID=2678685 RepID=UPI0018DB5FB4|nr:TRAP transporter substrate-binding protein [Mesorhizobium xinjiangense]